MQTVKSWVIHTDEQRGVGNRRDGARGTVVADPEIARIVMARMR